MVNKKGDQKYYIIMSLILGLAVLAISLFFIFNEYFTEDELDWHACRQSILLRSTLSSEKLDGLGLDVRSSSPLRCRTEVITIDTADQDEVYEKISRAIVGGWYMFGEGKFNFVGPSFLEEDVVCMAFARIHYTDKALNEFNEAMGDGESGWTKKGRYNLGFYNYYENTKMARDSLTYDDYLPMIVSLEENLGFAFVPLNVKFYPQEEDQILVYTMHKKKQGFFGWTSRQWLDVAGWSKFIASYLTGDEELGESAKENFIEAFGLERSIVIAYPDSLDSLGCKFLTIPA